uniref:Uncharacterized protein n=1 Tax=Aegilops tauschii subsp. strangulata TaxID=200361 RepID=A0A453C359_AEGTS
TPSRAERGPLRRRRRGHDELHTATGTAVQSLTVKNACNLICLIF